MLTELLMFLSFDLCEFRSQLLPNRACAFQVKAASTKDPILFEIDSMTLSEPLESHMIRDINNDFVQELEKSLTVRKQ